MEANIKEGRLNDITHFGIRLAVGVVFLVHGLAKSTMPEFGGFLSSLGLPTEIAPLIILAETVSGIMLIVGILNRIASSILSIIMLGAIFHVKKAAAFTGTQGAYEFDLILLAANLSIITMGPGRISIAHIAKKIPRFLH
ncbi:MAG TPA: DoxX family protein [Candidatus Nitrosotenuis sp.]|nr:DoxX family protein [Candidatus Nitrosotenuis sp.]